MEKVIYLAWRDPGVPTADWSATLRGAVAGRLAEAGATGVQVNVADDAVAGALMRLAALDPQPEAVVGLWVDSARDAARRPLDDAVAAGPGTARIAAYLVTESVPLHNTAHPAGPGERTEGFANIALLRRPAGMAPDEWIDAWHNGHTDVANETQSTFGYVQNVVARPLTPGAPAVDGIVEELFPIEALTSLHAFFAAADDDALARNLARMAESTARFGADRDIDVIPTSRYVM
ncbi:MAG TPA: EthD domain-containing protein [Acidimicrobiales bacterium]|nr:EthD domain-containing protein [Acidimicrobiales bacterium]